MNRVATGAEINNSLAVISPTLAGCTAGNGLLIPTYSFHSAGTLTISTATCPGETCVIQGSPVRSAGLSNAAFQYIYIAALAGSGTKTLTITLSGTPSIFATAYIIEIGSVTGIAYDIEGNAAAQTVNITTTAANDFIAAQLMHSGGTAAAGAAYTGYNLAKADDWEAGYAEYDEDSGAAGSTTVNFTGATGTLLIHAIALKAGAGGGGAVTRAVTFVGTGLHASAGGHSRPFVGRSNLSEDWKKEGRLYVPRRKIFLPNEMRR